MASENRENIYPGDTFPVAYECRKPNPDDPDDSLGLPAQPTTAFVRILDTLADDPDNAWLPIGGVGDYEAPADIEPKTGDTAEDKGAIVSYTVPATFTLTPGTYILYLTCEFPGGMILTENRKYKVLDFT